MSDNSVAAALIAGFVCVVLMLAIRPLAIAHQLVDKPGGRKRHVGHVPIIGGICMYSGFALGSVLAMPIVATVFLLLGASLLVFVGVMDDRYDLSTSVRFGAQFSAVLLMVFGGEVTVSTLGSPFFAGEIYVGSLSLLITVLLAIAVVNAINMTDGMDGLAGGLSLIALIGLAASGWGSSAADIAIVAAAVVAAFLGFNFPLKINRSIRTFMGDAGSTFLGYLIAWLCISVTQPPAGWLPPIAALGLVAVPLYDLTSCFFRRIFDGRSPFSADRNHFHHVLLEAGLKRRPVLGILLGSSAVIAALCLGLASAGVADGLILLVWILCGVVLDASLRSFRNFRVGKSNAQSA